MNKKYISSYFFVFLITLAGLVFRVVVSSPTWLHYDENYYINIAQNFMDRGELTPYMWRMGDVNIIAGGGPGYGVLFLNAWLRLVGFSLFGGRMLMVLSGLATAGIMYKVASLWWHSREAGLAAFVFAIVSTSSFYTLILKMDAIAILMYSLILLLHINAVRLDKGWMHFLLGIGLVISLEFHILGAIYLVALAFYYFVDQLRGIFHSRQLIIQKNTLYFGLGVLLAGTIYFAVHILPDPKAYFLITNECFECNEGFFVTESKRLVRLLFLRPVDMLAFITVFVAALTRRRREDIHYLLITGGWILAQSLAGTPPDPHYTNHGWLLAALGVGGFVAWGFQYQPSRWRIPACASIATVLLLLNFGIHLANFHPFLFTYMLEDSPSIDYIQQVIPNDTTIMGEVPSFYQLREYRNFVAYQDGTKYSAQLRNERMIDFWRRIDPKVVLLDESEVHKDEELITYLKEFRFVQIMSDLWVAQDLLAQKSLKMAPASIQTR